MLRCNIRPSLVLPLLLLTISFLTQQVLATSPLQPFTIVLVCVTLFSISFIDKLVLNSAYY